MGKPLAPTASILTPTPFSPGHSSASQVPACPGARGYSAPSADLAPLALSNLWRFLLAKSTSVSRPHWTENPTWQCLSFVGQCLKQEKNMGTCRTLQVMGTMCLTELLPKVENTTVTILEIPKDCTKKCMTTGERSKRAGCSFWRVLG